MENTNEEIQESFVTSLDQFFTSIEPVLKEANTIEAAEDILTNLETTDENFHRYEFVRKLRARIDKMLGPLIDMKLESLSGESNTNSLLSEIADEIQTSQEFIGLQQSVLTDTKEAVNILVQKYANPLQRGVSDFDFSDYKQSKMHTLKDSLDLSDEESLSSSIGQVGYMFMSQEKSGKIAENLHPLKPVQVKSEALTSLAQVPQSDIITSEHWPAIRKGLLAALADDDDHLSEKSLKFHARMFLCSTSHATREIYTCLAEHLWHCFNNKTDMMGKIEHGINVQTKNNARLIKRFRLLNEFQHEVPSYWTRYSERFLEEILESTFTLIDASEFQSSSSVDQPVSPLHYLSLLDPIATWFKKWTHGNYSRTEVVRQLKEHPKLLSDAVTAILDFPHTLKTAVTIPEILEDQDQQERQESGSEEGLFYSHRDLEFLFFVHSLSLVGRLFLYNDGRDLFPVELPDRQETWTVTDLLVVFIKIMCIPMPKSMAKAGLDGTIVPGDLVSDVLQEIASNSEAIRECLCKDAITSSLLAPVQNILDGLPDLDSNEESDSESVLLLISDVLAALAASESGRLQLLYGESQERWQRSRFSPSHIIAGFSKKALSDSLCCPLSNDVIGGFLFICRQLWTTSEGLIVLNQYALHEKVAQAWANANELHSMSATSIDEQDDNAERETIQNAESLVWESSLLDNLLNFAGTPKGVLLLQLTGMMDQCVGYMYKRYTQKLQVSKCEKFGYGVMVCQFAATAPGIVALEKKGFLQRLVQDVWMVFEGLHDRRLEPIIKHIDTIDSRAYNKALNNLLSVFSAFPAVYEVLTVYNRPSTSTSEVEEIKTVENELDAPLTLAELIDRLIIIDSDSKISSLFNYEQSHHFGLRVLNILCSCLDTLLFLESTYHFTELLLQAQLDNRLDNGKDYIIDRCSIERNQILVKSYWVGGPSERILPGRTLTEDQNNPYPWPLFSSFPPPKDYVVQDHAVITNAFEEGDSVLEFLEGEKPSKAESIEWLEKFRELFCTAIKSSSFKCKTKVLKLLMESVCHALTNIPEESIFPLIEFSVGELSLKNTELSSIETLGAKLVVRYGLQLKILQSRGDATDDLHHLLKYAKFFMRSQQKVPDSSLRTMSVKYPGHDWFVSTIFLMFGGDPDESREFLFKFSSLVCSGYLWIRRLHASVHLPTSLTVSGIPPLYSCTCHNIELILQAEVPLVFSALRMSGYTPSQICQHWLRQCFWNYLPWDHICLYMCVCLTLGIDYQVYFCIAIFKHLQQEILQSTQEQRLLVMLKEEPIRGFRLGDHLDFMVDLENRYRLTILSDLQNITRP